ncbi:MAG: cytochrome P450 [Parachlamydiaceae bacterium]
MNLTASPTEIFNDFHLSFVENPYYHYQQLPSDPTILIRSPGCWITKNYRVISDVLSDKRFQRNFWKNKIDQHGDGIKSEPSLTTMSHWILLVNPPDHTRLRDLIAPFFSRNQIDKWRSKIKETANRLIDCTLHRGSIDIINDFSLPLTMEFMYQILGIDPEEREEILSKTIPPRRLLDPPTPLSRDELNLENFNIEQLEKHVWKIYEERRNNPKEDLISFLSQAHKNDNVLTEKECISQIILLLFSGIDTVPHMIGNSILALHQHPQQLELLLSNPAIFPTALHELLRYVPPVHMINMEAAEDVTIDGQVIKQGNKIILLLAAGNRDPQIFNHPEVLDLSRQKKRLLSFSAGIHNCLGMHLGMTLFEIGLQTLLERLPIMEIKNINTPEWNLSYSFRGLKKLTALFAK